MRVELIIPACVDVNAVVDQLSDSLRHYQHDAIERVTIVCSRLSLMSIAALEAELQKSIKSPVQVIFEAERSVAGAWNRGIEIGMAAGTDTFMIGAIDSAPYPDCIDNLLRFGDEHPEVDLWSSTASREPWNEKSSTSDACDFSCFMLRASTIARHGWFDRHFEPAYFEDNDYATRLVLGGSIPKRVNAARHHHLRSFTIRADPAAAERELPN